MIDIYETDELEEESEPIARMFNCAVCGVVFVGLMDSLPLCEKHKDNIPKPTKTNESRIKCGKCGFMIVELLSHVSMGVQVNIQFCQNCGNNDSDKDAFLIQNKIKGEWK